MRRDYSQFVIGLYMYLLQICTLILRAAKGEYEQEDRVQEDKAQRKAHAVTKGFG